MVKGRYVVQGPLCLHVTPPSLSLSLSFSLSLSLSLSLPLPLTQYCNTHIHVHLHVHTYMNTHTHHSVGLRPTCGGPLKVLTWPHCTSLEWHSGEDLSLRGLDDLNTLECNSSTSHHVKGRRQRVGEGEREREREREGKQRA